MSKAVTPCIDVCKYKLKGHCIGCGMTEAQKRRSERLDRKEMAAFVAALERQQAALERPFWAWETAYRRKCERAGAPCPLDDARAES
ncbi:MAG: DUF1289 domain-containing protein [Rhodobacteraceae bacterium]|nr:MAG: DUF1289 domain-containing protein [Paracoccaceae bacterium]